MESKDFLKLSDPEKLRVLEEEWDSFSGDNLAAIATAYLSKQELTSIDQKIKDELLRVFVAKNWMKRGV